MEDKHYLFTSESVTEGHPDKVCDQIADAVLDEIMSRDPQARVACECIATTGMVFIVGEISTNCYVEIQKIARQVIADIGYQSSDYGFDSETCAVLTAIDEQSGDIAQGVNSAYDSVDEKVQTGAGDQGMMFGYACKETPELMPLPLSLSHKLTRRLAEVRKNGLLSYIRPDGKAQVTVEYHGDHPSRVETVVVSTQHDPNIDLKQLREDIERDVIRYAIPGDLLDENTKILINPTGRFVIGGPRGDSGLTGRKIIVDTYGGSAPHGGGSFSGKDPTKVDRSAAYISRYAAKNIVAAGLASRCLIELAYAIGVSKPVSVYVDTYGTGKLPDEKLAELAQACFDFTPDGIISELNLRRPIFRQTAAYGAFGRPDLDLPWERVDKVELLQKKAAELG